MKLTLPEIPPFIQATVRSIGAFVIIAIWARRAACRSPCATARSSAASLAGVLFGIEFLLIFPALQFTAASRATLFIYTAPFFVALGSSFLLGETLRAVQWLGLLCSFAGLVVAFGVPDASRDGRQLHRRHHDGRRGRRLGRDHAGHQGARKLRTAPAEKVLAYQLAVSIPMLALGALLMGERMAAMPSALLARLARLPDLLGGEPHLSRCGSRWCSAIRRAGFRPSPS